jgi:hypothetical protein
VFYLPGTRTAPDAILSGGGLAFASHNQTESASIVFSILGGGKVDPDHIPEVSCMTLETPTQGETEHHVNNYNRITDNNNNNNNNNNRNRNRNRASANDNPNKAAHQHNYPQSSHGGGRRIRPSSEGALNSSQLAFLLMVLVAGVYYVYSVHLVHLVPKAASICKSVVATTNNSNNNNSNKHNNNPRRRNKGSSSKVKKSSGKKF